MKNAFEFDTLAEFMDYFKDEDTCRAHFASIRFANGEYCPHCGHTKIYTFSNGKRYRCGKCRQDFTIQTKTVFGESKVPLRKWFIAIYLLSHTSKGISSVQLAKHVGVTQKTGWFMDHRLRKAMQQNGGQLFGPIEADESFIGGLEKNKHKSKRKHAGTGGAGKTAVFGLKSRPNGEVRARVVQGVSAADLQPIIEKNVAQGEAVYTDSWVGYNGLRFPHTVINHSNGKYTRGAAHTNGIESFWALFKRGYHGVYHWMSSKHMGRYLDEYTFRFNRRGMGMRKVFSNVVENVVANSPLPYKELIA